MQTAPHAVEVAFGAFAALAVGDLVSVMRGSERLGQARVVAVTTDRALLLPVGDRTFSAGDEVRLERRGETAQPPLEQPDARSDPFGKPTLRVTAAHETRTATPSRGPVLVHGFDVVWEERAGRATVCNQSADGVRDVTLDVYVNRTWVARRSTDALPAGGTLTLDWVKYDTLLRNVPGRAVDSTTVVARWTEGDARRSARVQSVER